MILAANNRRNSCALFLSLFLPIFLVACGRRDASSQSEHDSGIQKLDHMVKVDPSRWTDFAQDFKAFHEALKEEDWRTTYKYRTDAFKRAVDEDMYLNSMDRNADDWALVDYEILGLEMHDNQRVQAIMRYVEELGPKSSHNVVTWKKQPAGWRCEEAGPSVLSLFNSVNAPLRE